MDTTKLRGHGPRVFISYSFRDRKLAERVEEVLTNRGFQVRREDETSLVNQKLTEAIPRRIAQSEVVIQLLTASSNASAWVRSEFACASSLKTDGHKIVLLPIVLDRTDLSDEVKEWWFLDLAQSGITDEALDQIETICLDAIHLLPLCEDDPFSLAEPALIKALKEAPSDGKRLLVDSKGVLIQWALDTLSYAEAIDSPHKAQFISQEKKRLERLDHFLKIVDEVVRKLAIEATRALADYEDPAVRALPALRHFMKMLLGDLVVKAADVAPPAPHPLRSTLGEIVETARRSNLANHSQGYRNPGLYAWALEEQESGMVQMGMDSDDYRGVPVDVPRKIFGSMADAYTMIPGFGFDPKGELQSYTFVDYVLPQIAIHATYNLTNESTIRQDMDETYAWKLEQYRTMGLR